MTNTELKELCLNAVRGTAPANYTLDNVNAAVADGFKALAPSVNQFMKNKYDIFEIMVEAIDEVVPKDVAAAIAPFAEIQQVPQNTKAVFKQRVGKNRARKFLTQVGLSGVYETFRLDNKTFSVEAKAIGGGVTVDFERVLDGAESMTEVMDVVAKGMVDGIYGEIQKALRTAFSQTGVPTNNRATGNYSAAELQKLITTVKAYGDDAIIFAPPEFVAAMGADAIVAPYSLAGTGAYAGQYSPDDIAAIHNTGYVRVFRGTPIVQIPQSYTDEKNTTTYIDPQIAYVFPAGQEKVVKAVFEGNQQIYDIVNPDQSIELYTYRKFGVAILTYYNWCMYKNTSITQTYVNA
jgi:hypothetical protein